MHCPKCGQQQVSEETRFCSRCGLLLSGVAQVMANDGIIPTNQGGFTGTGDSPRRRGIKLGVFIFLLTFILVPIFGVIALGLNLEPWLPGIAVFLFGGGGILRIAYALMFESSQPKGLGGGTAAAPVFPRSVGEARSEPQLTAGPASTGSYSPPRQGRWMETSDLNQPSSVTDNTTKLLQEEENR
jgi:hypothetical protein